VEFAAYGNLRHFLRRNRFVFESNIRKQNLMASLVEEDRQIEQGVDVDIPKTNLLVTSGVETVSKLCTRRNLVEFARQIACGMAFLADRNVKFLFKYFMIQY